MVEIMNWYCTLYALLPIFLSGDPYAARAQRHRAGESATSALSPHAPRMMRHLRDVPRSDGVSRRAVEWRTRPPFGLHCGVGAIDCPPRQGDNVSVVMAL